MKLFITWFDNDFNQQPFLPSFVVDFKNTFSTLITWKSYESTRPLPSVLSCRLPWNWGLFLISNSVNFKEPQCVCGAHSWWLQLNKQAPKKKLQKSPQPRVFHVLRRGESYRFTRCHTVISQCWRKQNNFTALLLPNDLLCFAGIWLPEASCGAGLVLIQISEENTEVDCHSGQPFSSGQ